MGSTRGSDEREGYQIGASWNERENLRYMMLNVFLLSYHALCIFIGMEILLVEEKGLISDGIRKFQKKTHEQVYKKNTLIRTIPAIQFGHPYNYRSTLHTYLQTRLILVRSFGGRQREG